MLKKDADFWFDTWIENGSHLLKIVSWMNDEGLIDIGQITFLEYAAAIFLTNKESFFSSKFKEEIKKYALYLRLTNSSFTKSNLDTVEKIYDISKKLTDNSNGIDRYEYSSPIGKINIKKDDILAATTSTAIFKAIKNILYKDNIGGKFTVDIMGSKINKNGNNMDDHHIYPKSKINNFSTKSKFNSIANILFIDSTLNRVDIKDRIPSDYFDKIQNQKKSTFNCTQNLLDINEAKEINSEKKANDFIDSRAEKIAKLINKHF